MIANIRSLRLEPATDVRLAAAAAVRIGRVEDIDTGVQRAVHELERLRFVLAHPVEGGRGSDPAEVAASQDDARDFEAGRSQPPIIHHRPRVLRPMSAAAMVLALALAAPNLTGVEARKLEPLVY